MKRFLNFQFHLASCWFKAFVHSQQKKPRFFVHLSEITVCTFFFGLIKLETLPDGEGKVGAVLTEQIVTYQFWLSHPSSREDGWDTHETNKCKDGWTHFCTFHVNRDERIFEFRLFWQYILTTQEPFEIKSRRQQEQWFSRCFHAIRLNFWIPDRPIKIDTIYQHQNSKNSSKKSMNM